MYQTSAYTIIIILSPQGKWIVFAFQLIDPTSSTGGPSVKSLLASSLAVSVYPVGECVEMSHIMELLSADSQHGWSAGTFLLACNVKTRDDNMNVSKRKDYGYGPHYISSSTSLPHIIRAYSYEPERVLMSLRQTWYS
jgi:hypothetical protein